MSDRYALFRTTTLSSAPSSEPVTTEEAKDHLRVDIAEDDTLIDNLITASRKRYEAFTNRALFTQTWVCYADSWPEDFWYVPHAPLASVSSITYTDEDGNSQTEAATIYTADTDHEPGRIYLAYNQNWSSHRVMRKAIVVTVVAGSTTFDETDKAAVLMDISHLYDHRDAWMAAPTLEQNKAYTDLAWSRRIPEA